LPTLRYIGISFAKKTNPDIKLVNNYFEQALSINALSYETRKQYGKAYEYLGDAEAKDSEKSIFYYESLNQYEIAIKLKENYPELLKEYAGVLCKVKKYVRACQFLERAIQLNSTYFIAYYDLAKARLDFANHAHDRSLLDDFEIIEILLKSLDGLKELNNLESYYKKQEQVDFLREKIYRKIISFVMQLISKMTNANSNLKCNRC
jgi:tetratricopeptide (TPR) repeat protein